MFDSFENKSLGFLQEIIILQVNYGGLLLQALLEYWPRPYAVEEESDVDAGVSFFYKLEKVYG